MRVKSLLVVIIYAGAVAGFQSSQAPNSGHISQDETPISRRATALPHPGWKPPISLQQAIKLVEEYVEKEKINVSAHFLSEVRLISNDRGKESKGPLWYFFWNQNGTAAGTQLEFTVAMDGTVTRLASW